MLADRVGIIDHGHIVAEGTPAALKAEIGLPSVHAIPADEADRERLVAALAPYGEALGSGSARRRRPAARGARRARRRSSARSTTQASRSRAWRSRRPRSTTSSSPRPAARSRAPPKPSPTRRGRPRDRRLAADRSARAALDRPHDRQPAAVVFPLIFPMLLLLVNAGGLKASTELPGFPTDSFLAFALAVPFIQGALFSTMNAGTDLAKDIQTGFLNRLSLTSMRGVALIAGQLAGVGGPRPRPGRVLHRGGPDRRCPLRRRRARHPRALRLRRRDLDQLRRSRSLPRAPHRLGRGDPGPLPAPLRLSLSLLDEHAAEPDRASTGSASSRP